MGPGAVQPTTDAARPAVDDQAYAPTTEMTLMAVTPALPADDRAQREVRALSCVVEVLESVNRARLGPASVHEVLAGTTAADRRRLRDAAASYDEGEETNDALLLIATRLLRELVAAGRAIERDDAYLATDERDAAERIVGITTSRRRKTLAIVERTVLHLGRAVRARDVAEYVDVYLREAAREYEPLLTILARDMQNLGNTGDLAAVGRVRGLRSDGVVLYLPARLIDRRDEFLPQTPLTWLDYVAGVVAGLWEVHRQEAHAGGRKPRPISTQEVRAGLRADRGEPEAGEASGPGGSGGVLEGPVAWRVWAQDLDDPMTVQTALDTLSKGSSPAIRAVPQRTALWVPIDTTPDEVELVGAFATDADRVVEATQRAMTRLARPAVTVGDVEDELQLDDALALSGKSSAARVLSDLAKVTVDDGTGSRRARRQQRVHRLEHRGATLYCAIPIRPGAAPDADPDAASQLAAARRYASHEAVLYDLAALDWQARLERLPHIQSPIIALGRARVLALELSRRVPDVARAASEGCEAARALLPKLERARVNLRGWERFRAARDPGLPPDVQLEGPTLTPTELQALYAPVSPVTAAPRSPAAIVQRYSRVLKRVRNRDYRDRRSGDVRTSHQFYFDGVAARLHGVRLWGGAQARLAGLMAEDELGELRDGRYVLRALATDHLEQRLRAVAALAFLQPDGASEALRERARGDASPGVRELAIWALGFLEASDADEVAREAVREDPAVEVRRAAQRFLNAGPHWGWRS
jgi:hypothetical protein